MTVFLTAHEYSHKAPQIPDHAATFMSMYHVQHAAQAGMTPTDGWLKHSIQTHIVDVYLPRPTSLHLLTNTIVHLTLHRRLADGIIHCAGSTTYQICFRLPIPNQNPKP